eukprot:g16378.t1
MAEDSRVRRLPEELRTPPKPSEFTHIGNGAKRPKLTRQGSSSLLSKEDSARFVVTEKEFTQQFAHIYFTRLQLLRSHIRQQLVDNDEKTKVLEATNKLRKNTECILIGTFYKEMKLKPCILDEYTKVCVEIARMINIMMIIINHSSIHRRHHHSDWHLLQRDETHTLYLGRIHQFLLILKYE